MAQTSRLEHTQTSSQTHTQTRTSTVTNLTRSSDTVFGDGLFLSRRALAVARRMTASSALWVTETVTPAGWLVVALVALGVVAGLWFGWSLGWVLAWGGMALLVLCIPFLIGAHDYRVRLRLERDRVVAGSYVTGWVDVYNRAKRVSLPGIVDVPIGAGLVEAHVPMLRPQHTYSEQLSIAALQRGVIDVGPLQVGRGDPVGILRRDVTWPEYQTVYVHPRTTIIPGTSSGLVPDLDGLPTRDIVDADMSFHAVRDYMPGDSRRHVHWKSTAKTGRLMVRQYEESRHSRIAVLLGVHDDEYASADEFELAVSAAASLAQQAVRDRREVAVATSTETPELARGTVVSVRTIPTRTLVGMLDGFSEVNRSERASHLPEVAGLVAQQHPALSIVFLVTGSTIPLRVLQQAALTFDATTAMVVVRCETNADPLLRSSGQMRVLTIGQLDDIAQLIARGRSMTDLDLGWRYRAAALGYVVVGLALVTALAWPIYQTIRLGFVAGAAAIVGIGLAGVATIRRWPAWLTLAAGVGAYLVLVVPLAVPSGLVSIGAFSTSLLDGVTGIVLGWRELLTLELPLGSYQAVLVPFFALTLVGTMLCTALAIRSDRLAPLAVAAMLAMGVFGIAFGSTTGGAAWHIFGLRIGAGMQVLLAVLLVAISMAWLILRARLIRMAALARGAGVVKSVGRGSTAARVRRSALAATLLLTALAVGVFAAPGFAGVTARSTLRTGSEPYLVLQAQDNPLSGYRLHFTKSQLQTPTFSVSGDRNGIDRLRLATLDGWNGQRFTVTDPAVPHRFTRLSNNTAPGDAQQVTVEVKSGFQGIWMPMPVGVRTAPRFTGPRAGELADAFYRDSDTGSALVTVGLQPGDGYVLAALPTANPALGSPGASALLNLPDYPQLGGWLKAQNQPRTAAGLTTLFQRLSDRGYPSHALIDDADAADWIAALRTKANYTFLPSYAGHSMSRLEALFKQLLDQQNRAGADASPALLVAGVGDDEQFAAAAALIARAFGYESRVVLGVRLTPDKTGGVPVCTGTCVAGNTVAWVEVRAPGSSDWTTFDVDPQVAVSPTQINVAQQFPKHPTAPDRPRIDSVNPPAPQRNAEQAARQNTTAVSPVVSTLFAVLRMVGIAMMFLLLLLFAPIVLALAKVFRRRSRRRPGVPEAAAVGAWEELLSVWVDAGVPFTGQTREAIAIASGSPAVRQLAAIVDAAVFAQAPPSQREADAAWAVVDAERARIGKALSFRRRLVRAVNPTSFLRDVGVRARGRAHLGVTGAEHRRVGVRTRRRAQGRARRTKPSPVGQRERGSDA